MHRLRLATPPDATSCHEIEARAYDSGAAAPLDRIAARIDIYPEGFLVLEVDGTLVGFINSGCARRVEMSDDAFKALVGHDPEAPNAVILSVAVDPAHQGKGYATLLMTEFIARMRDSGKRSIHLMCRSAHLRLYERYGYRYTQPSASRHGGHAWHEMVLELPAGPGA